MSCGARRRLIPITEDTDWRLSDGAGARIPVLEILQEKQSIHSAQHPT